MDITPLIKQGQQVIQSYAGGRFRVSGQIYESAILVFPDHTNVWNTPDSVGDLTMEHFRLLMDSAQDVDVILLGTGAKLVFVPELRKALKEQGLHVEWMDSGAACRTYNVLMAEGRRVAAALLPVT